MSSPASSNPPSAPSPTGVDNKINTKAAGIVGIAVMCSRLLGLIREQVLSRFFGAGFAMDAFLVAFRIPNLLRDLFAEGALSTAFITVFSGKIATDGEHSAWHLANKVATLATIFMSFLTLVGIYFSPEIVSVLASGFGPEKAALTVQLTRVMFPFILMVSLAALVMGMLNARNVFGMPAMASSFFNLGSIIGGVSLGYWFDPGFGERALMGLAIGTLIGGFLQLVVQFPSLRRVGFRFNPDFRWRDSGVRQILVLMLPAVIAASAVQVNVMVNQNFASQLQDGAVSWLGYAFRLMQLPLGLFGVALGTVTLPLVSRLASLNDLTGVRSTLNKGLRLAVLLTLPSAFGLIFFSEPIISLIYQGRKFAFHDTLETAGALKFYALGLVAYSGIKVIAPAFYALGKKNLPMIVSFISIGTNYFLNRYVALELGYGHKGLAFCTSVIAIINFSILYVMMAWHLHGLRSRVALVSFIKVFLACVPVALICLAAQHWYFTDLATMKLIPKLTGVGATVVLAAIVFYATAALLRIEEMNDLLQLARRKLKRG